MSKTYCVYALRFVNPAVSVATEETPSTWDAAIHVYIYMKKQTTKLMAMCVRMQWVHACVVCTQRGRGEGKQQSE